VIPFACSEHRAHGAFLWRVPAAIAIRPSGKVEQPFGAQWLCKSLEDIAGGLEVGPEVGTSPLEPVATVAIHVLATPVARVLPSQSIGKRCPLFYSV